MRKIRALIIVVLSAALSAFFPGCVTDTASLKIEKSLPQNKLAYYNDPFDKFRSDLWDKAGLIYNEAQEANFKLAKMVIENGKLKVETKTGCFSKGGLGFKYGLRGNFDIQVECHIDFLKGVYDMDQMLGFLVMERGKAVGAADFVYLRLLKKGGNDSGTIFSASLVNGRYHSGNEREINNFDGTLRIVRKGSNITTLYKTKGTNKWEDLGTFWSTSNDLGIGVLLQNFTMRRRSITAKSPVTATFDNFRINAAEEIIEEDI
ncbi:MAG: hypothetical protein H8D67_06395 [Deltaproteobacteria bacterium]|nr:hypothetical protein [Deltaproteobacteria bacterium]